MSEFGEIRKLNPLTFLGEKYRTGKVEYESGGFIRSQDGELTFISEGEILSAIEAETGDWHDEQDRRETNGFNNIGAFFIKTDCGARGQNQDVFYLNFGTEEKPRLVMGVFDGMGGKKNGRLAASSAAVGLAEGVRQRMDVVAMYRKMKNYIGEFNPEGDSAGIVVDIEKDDVKTGKDKRVTILSSGDSRIITIRNGNILPEGTTTPQNLAQKELSESKIQLAEYYNHAYLNLLTGALGTNKTEPEIKQFVAQEDDIVIAASDGLGDVVSDYEILELLKRHPSMEEFHYELFRLARNRQISDKPFDIEISQDTKVIKRVIDNESRRTIGDNITIGVVKIKNYLV